MKEQLCFEYSKRLRSMFAMVRAHLLEKSFGSKKALINLTIPLMVLEKWRESGHSNEIPLLDETVKNVVLAIACSIFGWKKTCCLHLRVALENVFYGASLLSNPTALARYRNKGTLKYNRFSTLLADYVTKNAITKEAAKVFKIRTATEHLYSDLSKWTHTLGNEFVSDISILGYMKLDNSTIGQLKGYFEELSRICCVVYLTTKPDLFQHFCPSEQRMFLQPLELPEKKALRDLVAT